MAILHVAQLGHPVLRKVAREVSAEEITTPAFQQFCDDLLETMHELDGAGLAAPQVHASVRVAVLTLDREPEFFINPVIEVLGPETRRTWEGCLSVEGMRGLVERPAHIRVDALGRDGEPKAYELAGFPAVVVQHEFDHLDGVLYVDKVEPRSLMFVEQYRRFGPPDEYDDDDYTDEHDYSDEDDLELEE